MNYIDHIRQNIKEPERVSCLTEAMMWETHGPLIWQASKFDGTPTFYPVYHWKDYYSYSILALIIKKGNLKVNRSAFEKAAHPAFEALASFEIIDEEIVRIGGVAVSENSIIDPIDYVDHIIRALKMDINEIEEKNPGYTNLVLCGGRDSLNLLLLPWNNPVVALSAEPNYPLALEFVKNNDLDIEVRRLEDPFDKNTLKHESLECCCRIDMVHWRWGGHLKKIMEDYGKKAIIWKGQFGDNLLTPYWKEYVFPKTKFNIYGSKAYRKLSFLMPNFLKYWIGEKILKGGYVRAWHIFAQRQGAHMGFIRALCDTLALSAYHGKEMTKLYKKVNLARAVQHDIRAAIGRKLLGREAWYPHINPGPEVSKFRQDAHNPEQFINMLEENGIRIC